MSATIENRDTRNWTRDLCREAPSIRGVKVAEIDG